MFLGPPGTGKSHFGQAIGQAAIQQGYRVLYRETHTLLDELADATLDGTRKGHLGTAIENRTEGSNSTLSATQGRKLADVRLKVS